MQDDSIVASDVVGDQAPAGGMMAAAANLFARTGASSRRADPFALGERAAILHHLDQAALIPRVAETEGRRFPIEVRAMWGHVGLRLTALLIFCMLQIFPTMQKSSRKTQHQFDLKYVKLAAS